MDRNLAEVNQVEASLIESEKAVCQRGLHHLNAAVRKLSKLGDTGAARDSVEEAVCVFEVLGGFDQAAAALASLSIDAAGSGEDPEDSRVFARSSFESYEDSTDLILPQFTQVSQVSSLAVDRLRTSIARCERDQKSAAAYLAQARQAIRNFMFGMARKQAQKALSLARASFGYNLQRQLLNVDEEIKKEMENTALEGKVALQSALDSLGDLHIRTVLEEAEAAGSRQSIQGSGDVWAAQSAMQQARFLFGASGNQDILAHVLQKSICDDNQQSTCIPAQVCDTVVNQLCALWHHHGVTLLLTSLG